MKITITYNDIPKGRYCSTCPMLRVDGLCKIFRELLTQRRTTYNVFHYKCSLCRKQAKDGD